MLMSKSVPECLNLITYSSCFLFIVWKSRWFHILLKLQLQPNCLTDICHNSNGSTTNFVLSEYFFPFYWNYYWSMLVNIAKFCLHCCSHKFLLELYQFSSPHFFCWYSNIYCLQLSKTQIRSEIERCTFAWIRKICSGVVPIFAQLKEIVLSVLNQNYKFPMLSLIILTQEIPL